MKNRRTFKRYFGSSYFLFRVSIEDKRSDWLNSRQKFLAKTSLRKFNMGRKKKGRSIISLKEWKNMFLNVVYTD